MSPLADPGDTRVARTGGVRISGSRHPSVPKPGAERPAGTSTRAFHAATRAARAGSRERAFRRGRHTPKRARATPRRPTPASRRASAASKGASRAIRSGRPRRIVAGASPGAAPPRRRSGRLRQLSGATFRPPPQRFDRPARIPRTPRNAGSKIYPKRPMPLFENRIPPGGRTGPSSWLPTLRCHPYAGRVAALSSKPRRAGQNRCHPLDSTSWAPNLLYGHSEEACERSKKESPQTGASFFSVEAASDPTQAKLRQVNAWQTKDWQA